MNFYNQIRAIEKRLHMKKKSELPKVVIWDGMEEYQKAKSEGKTKDTINIIDNITRTE